ncbi:MAG: hypothetical protein SPG64_02575 [Candidatus Enteromonas sp.]|nr:hypothetical protein [Candidatus Enteromonas sp.]
MILFVVLMIVGALVMGGCVYFLFAKKHRFASSAILVSTGIYSVLTITSCCYHQLGNEDAYKACLAQKATILRKVDDAKSIDDSQRQEEVFTGLKQEIFWYNHDLETNRDNVNSAWIGCFSYAYALDHFDELYIEVNL